MSDISEIRYTALTYLEEVYATSTAEITKSCRKQRALEVEGIMLRHCAQFKQNKPLYARALAMGNRVIDQMVDRPGFEADMKLDVKPNCKHPMLVDYKDIAKFVAELDALHTVKLSPEKKAQTAKKDLDNLLGNLDLI